MSEMKLIMERWDNYILSEIETVGQLKKVIRDFRVAKGATGAAKIAADSALAALPIAGNIYTILSKAKDGKDAMAALMGTDDKFISQTGLDKLNIDDNISQIVDDKIEAAFLNHVLQTIDGMNEFEEIPDVNLMLQDFLKGKFAQHTVKK